MTKGNCLPKEGVSWRLSLSLRAFKKGGESDLQYKGRSVNVEDNIFVIGNRKE